MKQEGNGWFQVHIDIGPQTVPVPVGTETKIPDGVTCLGCDIGGQHSSKPSILILVWDDRFADLSGVAHLCGLDCLQKYIAKNSQRITHG
jgi:hypothetical protein